MMAREELSGSQPQTNNKSLSGLNVSYGIRPEVIVTGADKEAEPFTAEGGNTYGDENDKRAERISTLDSAHYRSADADGCFQRAPHPVRAEVGMI
jgi:hypothetical protein